MRGFAFFYCSFFIILFSPKSIFIFHFLTKTAFKLHKNACRGTIRATWRRTVARNSLILLTFQDFITKFKCTHSTFNLDFFTTNKLVLACYILPPHGKIFSTPTLHRIHKFVVLSADFTAVSDVVHIIFHQTLTLICIVASVITGQLATPQITTTFRSGARKRTKTHCA